MDQLQNPNGATWLRSLDPSDPNSSLSFFAGVVYYLFFPDPLNHAKSKMLWNMRPSYTLILGSQTGNWQDFLNFNWAHP